MTRKKPPTKLVSMTLTVRVPDTMTAREARREVRTLINHQCNYLADQDDVRVSLITGGPRQ